MKKQKVSAKSRTEVTVTMESIMVCIGPHLRNFRSGDGEYRLPRDQIQPLGCNDSIAINPCADSSIRIERVYLKQRWGLQALCREKFGPRLDRPGSLWLLMKTNDGKMDSVRVMQSCRVHSHGIFSSSDGLFLKEAMEFRGEITEVALRLRGKTATIQEIVYVDPFPHEAPARRVGLKNCY